ncbi:hypothetical protein [Legionella hackeliae]|uniref:Uncharacterized protein n=1 Tax=Legionella hackeliae TaxID=449 RepID=A0A0A8URZ7_LEGHA|nr:hypothetical protein [Legionella hackeliae]KTD14840.1 hypothetical protein Lhac_0370 [Legionella hackeliae]CEK09534.1 protein of unknown function [Legionella hackeliae]STX49441.1 Uncharacterised protein [Legionella hackeliae]
MKLFDSILLLHIYDYQKPVGATCPLELLKKGANPLLLSTCMRHFYLFSSEQLGENKSLPEVIMNTIHTPTAHQKIPLCELFRGRKAYEILLFWSIAGLNPKKPFDDERILGDLRKICTGYEKTPSPIKQEAWRYNKKIMLGLLTDAKHLLELTKQLSGIPLQDRKSLLITACTNCAWARDNGFMPFLSFSDYDIFLDRNKMIAHLTELLEGRKEKAHEKLRELAEEQVVLSFLFSQDPVKLALEKDLALIAELKAILEEESLLAQSISALGI